MMSLAGAATSIIFVVTTLCLSQYNFCRHTHTHARTHAQNKKKKKKKHARTHILVAAPANDSVRDAKQYVLRCPCGARAGIGASVIGALASRESNGGDSLTRDGFGDRGRAWGILQVKHHILCAIYLFILHNYN